jgi:hypothetical protein
MLEIPMSGTLTTAFILGFSNLLASSRHFLHSQYSVPCNRKVNTYVRGSVSLNYARSINVTKFNRKLSLNYFVDSCV